ncbi:hypothetical protein FIU97_14530 [Roseivivax sp. THAF40]|nr:hypothetical protein FIU97_14530 [Roseivivax sp. THAF40]
MFVDQFEDGDVIYFDANDGLTINTDLNRLLIFRNTARGWIVREFSSSDVLDLSEEEVVSGADQATHGWATKAHAVGAGMGAPIITSRQMEASRNLTGVRIKLRSTDLPNIFIHVSNPWERKAFVDAMRQALRGGRIYEFYGDVPDHVRQVFQRPAVTRTAKSPRNAAAATDGQNVAEGNCLQLRRGRQDLAECEPTNKTQNWSVALLTVFVGMTIVVAIA